MSVTISAPAMDATLRQRLAPHSLKSLTKATSMQAMPVPTTAAWARIFASASPVQALTAKAA